MAHLDNELPWTGERLVTQLINHEGALDHLHRYARARELCHGLDVLDIASGEGYGSHLLAEVAKSVVGVDISTEAVSFAQQKYNRENLLFKEGSAAIIPMADSSLDVVVSFETLEHHDQHDEMFLEIKRVLRPGGILIISSPEKSVYNELDPDNPFHVKELDLADFKKLVSKYFMHHRMMYQRFLEASIITVEDEADNVLEFSGNFEKIEVTKGLSKWYYNICVASDKAVAPLAASLFRRLDAPPSPWAVQYAEQQRIEKRMQEEMAARLQALYSSRTYRFGQLLTAPLKFFRKH